ncbi:MAG: tRNA pseudouridine(55) synthase TruB [Gammaproteobacteria bacterium]
MNTRADARRDLHGIVLLDKPERMTSNQALQAVKRALRARKAGHTGSLDPLASGLLPICLGEATKVSAFLLEADKEYEVTGRLGNRTATGDAEGAVIATCAVPELDAAAIELVLAGFRGEIRQTPPMYSALKHQGQRLYDLARAGIEVPRAPRAMQVHALELLGFDPPHLSLQVRCSKGLYVRTLVEDIAHALGTCAYVVALRRLAVGPFGREHRMQTLAEVQQRAALAPDATDEWLLPIESALAHWPEARLGVDAEWYFCRGQTIMTGQVVAPGPVRVYGTQRLLGIGEALTDGRIAPRRLLNLG